MELVWIATPQNRRSSGFVSLILGILILLFAPFVTSLIGTFLSALVLIISIFLMIFGGMLKGTGLRIPLFILGLFGFVLGITALISPDLAVSVIGIFLGVWLILLGAGQLVLASRFSADRIYYPLTLLGGTLTVIIGLYLIVSPLQGMQIVVLFIGCYLAAFGLLSIIRPQYAY
jgi:uncharacterized membrane protein HdeD (DUF308 family)